MEAVKRNCLSSTGNNLRHLMRLVGRARIDDMKSNDIDHLNYNTIPVGEEWKIETAADVIELKNGNTTKDIFTRDEINDLLVSVVT